MRSNPLASSGTHTVDPETLAIRHPKREVTGVRVVKKGQRYRFEMVD